MVLEAEGQARLALWQTKLIMTDWSALDTLRLPLTGLNLDKVWENIVTRIAGIEIEQGRTLDEQIAVSAQREKLLKEISKLEKQARAERQPKKKFELVQRINQLKSQAEVL